MGESFGSRLVRLRRKAGFLQQGEFAKAIKVTQPFLSMLERDARQGEKVQAGTLLRIARPLGVSVEYLLTGRERTRAAVQEDVEALPVPAGESVLMLSWACGIPMDAVDVDRELALRHARDSRRHREDS